jgi:voltage-gated potassium channel Kch
MPFQWSFRFYVLLLAAWRADVAGGTGRTAGGARGQLVSLALTTKARVEPTEEDFIGDTPPRVVSKDYNPETPWHKVTTWKEEKRFRYPVSVEATIAILWITMVAGMPFLVIKIEGKEFTRTQAIVFFTMWLILFSGIFLFTQILYFQSNHFEFSRRLTIVESVYFLAQVLTTVGYGDVTPATPRAQVFVALYVLFSLLVIANVLSEVGDCISKQLRKMGALVVREYRQAQSVVDGVQDRISFWRASDDTGEKGCLSEAIVPLTRAEKLQLKPMRYFEATPPTLEYLSVLGAVCQFTFFVVVGVLFYHHYPGEEKTIFNAVYMSVITLSTVGFGVVTPQTEAGKVFGAFWMLFGSAALVGVITALTDLYDQIKRNEQWHKRDHVAEGKAFVDECPQDMDKLEFIKRSLLWRGGLEEDDIKAIEYCFNHAKPPDSETVMKADFEDLLEGRRKSSRSQGSVSSSVSSGRAEG